MAFARPQTVAGPSSTLLDAVFPQNLQASSAWLRNTAIVLGASILLTLSAKLSIPFFPVPMTLQTMVVLCLGMVLGPRLGAAAVLAYLAAQHNRRYADW